MNDEAPLVSVVVPMYNEKEYVAATLSSLGHQKYRNIQVIVVDDASDDNSVSVAEERLSKFNLDYSILENSINLGQTFSMNRGAMHAEGEYIIFHDADDVSTPDRISKQVEFMESNPSVGVLGSANFYINPERNQKDVRTRPTEDGLIRQGMGKQCMINAGTAMYRREALFGTKLFESENVEGYELMINIATEWSLANLREPLYMYRINEGSRSQRRQLTKKLTLIYRGIQATRKLGLPYWYIPLQLGWLVYTLVPDKGKALIRRVFSPTEERGLSEEERQTLQQLKQYE